MTDPLQRYIVQQRKITRTEKDVPVFAKIMRSKEGVFEGVSFIRNRDKASVLDLEQAQQAVNWIKTKKPLADLYETTLVFSDQFSDQ